MGAATVSDAPKTTENQVNQGIIDDDPQALTDGGSETLEQGPKLAYESFATPDGRKGWKQLFKVVFQSKVLTALVDWSMSATA